MNLQLISGQFPQQDALDIITQMVNVKIRYHEKKISGNSNEEDVKSREAKIKRLQKELYEIRKKMLLTSGNLSMDASVNLAEGQAK
jgi:hypothetical protein